jgi:putative lipoic acid-binding regulatory protein
MAESYDSEKFKSLLEDQYDWPTHYTYKFIVPTERLDELKELLSDYPADISQRESRKGTYTSVTVKMKREGPEEVIIVYQKASYIKGLVSL